LDITTNAIEVYFNKTFKHWILQPYFTVNSQQTVEALLVGAEEPVKEALVRLRRFVDERTKQEVGWEWFRVDALLLLLTQVSVLTQRSDQTVHTTHRLHQLRANCATVCELRLEWL
jgi:hypothetical protein